MAGRVYAGARKGTARLLLYALGSAALIDLHSQEIVFRVDFDLLDDDGCLRVSTRFGRGRRPPKPGARVYLLDGSGRGCVGLVEDATGSHASVRPDWSTWTGDRLPIHATRQR